MNTPLVELVRTRLSNRPDSEHGQAAIRVIIFTGVILYMAVAAYLGALPADVYVWSAAMSAIGAGVGFVLLLGILRNPGSSHVRRIIGMATDYGLMTAAMALKGEPLAWLYVILMWVTVGNGLRYGNRYLVGAVASACLSFGVVLWLTPYWHQNIALGLGLWFGLIAIPMYLSGLLRDLTRATDEARRANEAKSSFLANMSHEFRTPLNGLAGMSDLLATTRLDSEQRECVSTIQASARTLLGLVEDVLDISAIEAGKIKSARVEFSPRDLVEGIGLILVPQARGKQIQFSSEVDADVPAMLRGDAGHLRQVLLNLAGNAVKFTDEGSVELRVSVLSHQPGVANLCFTVTDTGIGIPAHLHDRLFDAFEQADVSLSRRYGGTGLGTTIAKRLAEAMGGSIGFESEEHRGSRFWVKLPFEALEGVRAVDAAQPLPGEGRRDTGGSDNIIAFSDPFLRHRARVRSMQILVADDHEANRMVLQRLLQKAGHRVTCVDGGGPVLDALETADYDAVVCDLHMPDISGLDLLKQLRVMEAGSGSRTPVLILSADVTPESISSCERAGAKAFLAKPVVVTRLLDTLAEIAAPGDAGAMSEQSLPLQANLVGDGVLDLSVLDELSGMDMGDEFERKFVAQCLADAETCIVTMARAVEQTDCQQVREQAHALKGVASNLGLIKLATAAGQAMGLPDWQVSREGGVRLSALKADLDYGRAALEARQQLRARASQHGAGK